MNKIESMADQTTSQDTLHGVSIIVVQKNGTQNIERLLNTFLQNNTHRPVEFIIVNQNLDENMSSVIKQYSKDIFIRLIRRANGFSHAEASNIAAKKARFPYLLFIDDCIVYIEDALHVAVEKLSDQSVGAVGICIYNDLKKDRSEKEAKIYHSGVSFEWDEQYEFHRPVLNKHNSLLATRGTKNNYCLAVTGGFLLCRKTDFNIIGGLCEEYECGLEDIDFCILLGDKLKKKCYCINMMSLHYTENVSKYKDNIENKEKKKAYNEQIFKYRAAERVARLIRKLPDSINNESILPATIVQKSVLISEKSINVLFVLPFSQGYGSWYHVQQLDRSLRAQGIECKVTTPLVGGETIKETGNDDTKGQVLNFDDITFSKDCEGEIKFSNGQSADIIHAWTPRESVRKYVDYICLKNPCPVIIHLKKDEEYLTEMYLGKAFTELEQLSEERLDKIVPENCYHPSRGREWLKKAQGITMTVETLGRFNYIDIPSMVLPPTVDESLFYPRPINLTLRNDLNIPEEHIVIGYSGNVHIGNREETRRLYRAVKILNEQGYKTILLRTGNNTVHLGSEDWIKAHEINLGVLKRKQVADTLAAADILVQPGLSDSISAQCIPIKLSEYFAMGRPIILPQANFGQIAKHGKDAYVTKNADENSIVDAVKELKVNGLLRKKLAEGAVEFYLERVADVHVGERLVKYYKRILG